MAVQISSGRTDEPTDGPREIMRGRKHFHFHPPVVLITHSAAIARIRIQSDKSGTTGRSIHRHNIPRCLSSLNGADSPPAHLIGDRMHDCQQGERGSLTRRQLGGEKRDRSRREVLSSSTQKEGWNTPTRSYHFRTPILRGREGGRRFSCRFRIG